MHAESDRRDQYAGNFTHFRRCALSSLAPMQATTVGWAISDLCTRKPSCQSGHLLTTRVTTRVGNNHNYLHGVEVRSESRSMVSFLAESSRYLTS